MIRTRCFHCHGEGSISSQGIKIPQAVKRGQKIFFFIKIPEVFLGGRWGEEGA